MVTYFWSDKRNLKCNFLKYTRQAEYVYDYTFIIFAVNDTEESLIIDLECIMMDINKWNIDRYLLETKDLYDILDDYLKDLDCTIEFKCGRPMMTTYSQYKTIIAEFLKILNKLPGYSIYNEYIDKLINRHIENILFEFNNPIVKKKPTKSKKQKDKPNKWIKAVTNDIFTRDERYSSLKSSSSSIYSMTALAALRSFSSYSTSPSSQEMISVFCPLIKRLSFNVSRINEVFPLSRKPVIRYTGNSIYTASLIKRQTAP